MNTQNKTGKQKQSIIKNILVFVITVAITTGLLTHREFLWNLVMNGGIETSDVIREEKKSENLEKPDKTEKKKKKKNTKKNKNQEVKEATLELKKGDSIKFCKYQQKAGNAETDSIEWMVLEVADGNALLISQNGIENAAFDNTNPEKKTVSWGESGLREWLNKSFYDIAFTDEEKNAILDSVLANEAEQNTTDKVFLLSIDEVKMYFENAADRYCTPTEKAKDSSLYIKEENGCCMWWLRTNGNVEGQVVFVRASDGEINEKGYPQNNLEIAVRPAMWVAISGLSK